MSLQVLTIPVSGKIPVNFSSNALYANVNELRPRANSTRLTTIFGQNKIVSRADSVAGACTASWKSVMRDTISVAAALSVFASISSPAAFAETEYATYYGTAASASSYGGYGGNTSKRDAAEYVYDVPSGWKERNISKVEKGTNGTDSEFFNPKKKVEKVYVTYLAGFRRLPPQENVLNNLALSDVNLQDQIGTADKVESKQRSEAGQPYYDFEIDSPIGHSLISVTCTKNKLYAHFVNAPVADWSRDEAVLRHIHESFQTVGGPVGVPGS